MNIARFLSILLLAGAAGSAAAAAAGAPPAPAAPQPSSASARVPADLATFFTGDWAGQGQFVSGKPIAADVSFHLELDGQWLQYRHTDRAPGRYKALGMWGIDSATHKLVMTLNDSSGAARTFTSDGWTGGMLAFVRTISTEPLREERFVFTRVSGDSFRMAYEVHAGDQPWRMIDQLVFERSGPQP